MNTIRKAVIGASYGDEGKGRTVDWLAAPYEALALVVRTNGGAQAAHTVVRGGIRHVFHHVGSGALAGARTHLSRFMVSHPIVFAEERAALLGLGANLKITADPRGYVSTPWDMMVNQALELKRDHDRHGSCGLGFGETIGRCEESDHPLTVGDLFADGLEDKLIAIAHEWLPGRIAKMGLEPDFGPLAYARSAQVIDAFLAQCASFTQAVSLHGDAQLGQEKVLFFEGAQGLLLDQRGADFPFVTRSNTGIANIAAIADEAGISEIEPIYITRCYLTRHGRGPMDDERAIGGWFDAKDPTNQPNPWQESLRFGLLDIARLVARIRKDAASVGSAVRPSLAVSCLDQAQSGIAWLENGELFEGTIDALCERIAELAQMPVGVRFASPSNAEMEAVSV